MDTNSSQYLLLRISITVQRGNASSILGTIWQSIGLSYNMLCFTERHVFLEVMFYLRVGIIGGHVLLCKCLTGLHVLQEGISYRMICD